MSVSCSALVLAALSAFGLAACDDDDPKLKVTDISPDKGDSKGGTYVVIKGNRFIKDGPRNAKVYFGSRQGTVVRFSSDSELVVMTPTAAKTDEAVDVLVIFDPGGQLVIKKGFKFVDKIDAPTIDDLDTNKPAPKQR